MRRTDSYGFGSVLDVRCERKGGVRTPLLTVARPFQKKAPARPTNLSQEHREISFPGCPSNTLK